MTLDEIKQGDEWSDLEKELIRCAPLGVGAVLAGKEDCPSESSDPTRRVRAGLIRFLLLGGGKGCLTHAKGVMLQGAWVDGALDFEGEKTRLNCLLRHCLFPSPVSFRDAELRGLYLPGSALQQGFYLQRVKTETDVHLSQGFKAQGVVDLAGARIGGQVDCSGGSFHNAEGRALNCNSAVIAASVLLRDDFSAEGEVNLVGARISGQVACDGGSFRNAGGTALNCAAAVIGADVFLRSGFSAEGEVNLVRAQIGGQLACDGGSFHNAGGMALNCEAALIGADVFLRPGEDKDGKPVDCHVKGALNFTRATIKGGLQIRKARLEGPVALRLANIGILADDAATWQAVTRVYLEGLTYGQIDSNMTVGERLHWLARKEERAMPFAHKAGPELMPWLDLGRSFDPQPYTQFAQVLAAAGNRSGAARVRCVREGLISQAEYRRSLARLDGSVWSGFVSLGGALRRRWDILFGWMFGHGHRPARAFIWVFAIIGLAALLYGHIFDLGQMAPNSAVILTSDDWQRALQQPGNPLPHWLASETAKDYETFSALLYATDLFLPLDAIGQEGAWAPSYERGWWGEIGYWMRAPIQLAGWVIAAMAAAVVTGLVGRSDDKR